MTPIDYRDLGKRTAMNPLFTWEPGMLATTDDGWTGRVINPDKTPFVVCRRSAVLGNPHSGEGTPFVQIISPGAYPDLTDPATIGVLRNRINQFGYSYSLDGDANKPVVTPSYTGIPSPITSKEALEVVEKLEKASEGVS